MKKTTAMKRWMSLLLAALLAAALLPALGEETPAATAIPEAPAAAETPAAEHPVICISVKDYGDIYAELYPDTAPITVANFLKLTGEHFYDGLTFHRIISGFMIQGGDPLGNGTGGSSEQIKGEFSSNGVENPLKHSRGVLSMARSSLPDSASSQFFIMHADATHLDGNYAAFGQVLSGMWIVDKICQGTPVQDQNGTVAKEDQPVIETIREAAREEADAALAAEEANGKSGTVYRDRLSNLSFPVPEGWNRYVEAMGRTIFVPADMGHALFLIRTNQWDSLPAAYKQYFAENGQTRKDMGTDAFKKESLIGMTGQNADSFTAETHSGVKFYTAEVTAESGSAVYYVGAHDAYVYVLVYNGTKADEYFGGVTAILDSLTFD